jgi:hypothetical protein
LDLSRFSLGLVADMASRFFNLSFFVFFSGRILPLHTSGSSFHLPVCLPIYPNISTISSEGWLSKEKRINS